MKSHRKVIKEGSKSFALASLFFPEKTRFKIYALYAWLRHCDDVIDSPNSDSKNLLDLKSQIFQNDADPNSDTQFQQIKELLDQKKIHANYFEEFFEGLRMDLENKGYDTLPELELYCFRVAGVVGLMMCPLIGATRAEALPHAHALGVAMQLTNICRDVAEDARNNRIYLPRRLTKETLSPQIILESSELCHPAIKQLLARSEVLYELGNEGLQYLPLRAAFAVGSASFIYRKIGQKIQKDLAGSLKQRFYVNNFEKMKCVLFGLYHALKSRFSISFFQTSLDG